MLFRLALVIATLAPALASAASLRVLSLNVCADQMVMAYADPSQIIALSPHAADPALSYLADRAKQLRKPVATAELGIREQAQLAFVGPIDRLATSQMLERNGLAVERLPIPQSIETAKRQMRSVAAKLGHPDRAEADILALDAAIAAGRQARSLSVLPLERRGYVAGPDSLLGDLLQQMGHRHVLPDAGIGRLIRLEEAIMLRPDIIITSASDARRDQGEAMLFHPAFRSIKAARVEIPAALTSCPSAGLIEAANRLAAAVRQPSRQGAMP